MFDDEAGVLPPGQRNLVDVFLPASQFALDKVSHFKSGGNLLVTASRSRVRLRLNVPRRNDSLRLLLNYQRRQKQKGEERERQVQNLAQEAVCDEGGSWWS